MERAYGFVLDIDGTLDDRKGQIHQPIIPLLAAWLEVGADIVFVTNRPQNWVADKILRPIAARLTNCTIGRVYTACEQGAHLARVATDPDSLNKCRPIELAAFPLKHRLEIEAHLQQAIDRGIVCGQIRRDVRYQVCLENIGDSVTCLPAWLPGHLLENTRLRRTRSTLTFVPRSAGKDVAVRLLLRRFPTLASRTLIGFGDDGDEFASVVPTVDVDRLRRRTFQRRGYRAVVSDDPLMTARLGVGFVKHDRRTQQDLGCGGGVATAAFLRSLLNATRAAA